MNTRELQDRIIELKKEKDVCILAHAYQSHDIWEVADYVGDSYGLSVQAAKAPQKTVIMAGVRFMAETVKVLSPEKKVLLANDLAGCTMALQMDRDKVLEMQKENPGYATVAYINTTSELKTAVDVVVTSSSAVKILKNMPEKDKKFAKKYLGHKNDKKLCFEIIRAALSSCADTAIIPMQDYLELDSSARINTPSTLGCNWKWRMDKNALDPKLAKKIYKMAKLYARV